MYIGSGNRVAVFTRRSRPAFSKLKQVYGDHMENMKVQHHELRKDQPVAEEVRKKVRQDLKKEYVKTIWKQIPALIISLLIIGLLLIIFWEIILAL